MPTKAATYLDANAGAPLGAAVGEALREILASSSGAKGLANPSSIHSHGRHAKRRVAEARERVARSLGAKVDAESILFTSSGSEANQLAVQGYLQGFLSRGEKPHWILSAVEHDSNLQSVAWLKEEGGSVSFLPVDEWGRPDPVRLSSLFQPRTRLVSVLWVNNETGVITDVAAISSEVDRLGGALHLDAAQAWGKIPMELDRVKAAFVTLSAHKIGAPAGTGVLYVRPGHPISPLIRGKQEKGRRGGTENLLGITLTGVAAGALDPSAWSARVAPTRDRMEWEILKRIPGVRVHGMGAPRVANTTHLGFVGIEGDGLIMALDLAGYSVASGSACSSGVLGPSHVLLAMGFGKQEATSSIRVSLADALEEECTLDFVKTLESTVARVRSSQAKSEMISRWMPEGETHATLAPL